MRLNSVKRQRLIDTVEKAPWGDIAASWETVDLGLRRALDATVRDFRRWEWAVHMRGDRDEFSVDGADVAAMLSEERLAYVARLLRSIALSFGTETEISEQTPSSTRQPGRDTIAPLLARIIEIATSADEADAVLDEAENQVRKIIRGLALPDTAPRDRHWWFLRRVEGDTPTADRRRPVEKRAMGLMMRMTERDGAIESPPALRELVASTEYPAEEVDRAFLFLVTEEGRTVGGTLELADLDARHIGKLQAAELIEWNTAGEWTLTDKGQTISSLLSEYADPKYEWRSLLSDDDPPVFSA
jgi:hypothetical protein